MELVETIVADGGSIDATTRIAVQWGAKVIPNKLRLAEYGVKEGVLRAKGDLVVIFAADNELPLRNWLEFVARPFMENPDLAAVWGRQTASEADPAINKYYSLIQNDPFNYFMNRNLGHYLAGSRRIGTGTGSYHVFRVDPTRPLVWGANGLVYRLSAIRHIWDRLGYLGDNDAFQAMIEKGHNLVAYMPSLPIHHHHVRSVKEWRGKWQRDFTKHFLGHRTERNLNWVFTTGFKARLVLWLAYGVIPVGAIFHSIANMIMTRNRYWLYHAPVCVVQSEVMLSATIGTKEGRTTIISLLRQDRDTA